MSRAFIFPGQGSQQVGMGASLWENFAEAREIFQEVDESLGQNLRKIMFEGPEESLNLTENTQPALMAVSMAVVAVLQKQSNITLNKKCIFMAGHSLGEYSALTAAGSLEVAVTARLLRLRGQSMQKAVPVGIGAMAAILGLSLEDVQAIADIVSNEASDTERCEVANDNSPGQIVISGHKAAVEKAMALAAERGAKRAIALPVSAPFHCSLMQPAAAVMREALAQTRISAPGVPVVANVTAQAENDPGRIADLLAEQITGRVRWRESVLWMKDQGVSEMYELGSKKILQGLVRQIDKDITCESIGEPQQIEELIKKLG
jgi:[acyl-carrier-protein] S-malonyltransferase